jgi:hypothetical protein
MDDLMWDDELLPPTSEVLPQAKDETEKQNIPGAIPYEKYRDIVKKIDSSPNLLIGNNIFHDPFDLHVEPIPDVNIPSELNLTAFNLRLSHETQSTIPSILHVDGPSSINSRLPLNSCLPKSDSTASLESTGSAGAFRVIASQISHLGITSSKYSPSFQVGTKGNMSPRMRKVPSKMALSSSSPSSSPLHRAKSFSSNSSGNPMIHVSATLPVRDASHFVEGLKTDYSLSSLEKTSENTPRSRENSRTILHALSSQSNSLPVSRSPSLNSIQAQGTGNRVLTGFRMKKNSSSTGLSSIFPSYDDSAASLHTLHSLSGNAGKLGGSHSGSMSNVHAATGEPLLEGWTMVGSPGAYGLLSGESDAEVEFARKQRKLSHNRDSARIRRQLKRDRVEILQGRILQLSAAIDRITHHSWGSWRELSCLPATSLSSNMPNTPNLFPRESITVNDNQKSDAPRSEVESDAEIGNLSSKSSESLRRMINSSNMKNEYSMEQSSDGHSSDSVGSLGSYPNPAVFMEVDSYPEKIVGGSNFTSIPSDTLHSWSIIDSFTLRDNWLSEICNISNGKDVAKPFPIPPNETLEKSVAVIKSLQSHAVKLYRHLTGIWILCKAAKYALDSDKSLIYPSREIHPIKGDSFVDNISSFISQHEKRVVEGKLPVSKEYLIPSLTSPPAEELKAILQSLQLTSLQVNALAELQDFVQTAVTSSSRIVSFYVELLGEDPKNLSETSAKNYLNFPAIDVIMNLLKNNLQTHQLSIFSTWCEKNESLIKRLPFPQYYSTPSGVVFASVESHQKLPVESHLKSSSSFSQLDVDSQLGPSMDSPLLSSTMPTLRPNDLLLARPDTTGHFAVPNGSLNEKTRIFSLRSSSSSSLSPTISPHDNNSVQRSPLAFNQRTQSK